MSSPENLNDKINHRSNSLLLSYKFLRNSALVRHIVHLVFLEDSIMHPFALQFAIFVISLQMNNAEI